MCVSYAECFYISGAHTADINNNKREAGTVGVGADAFGMNTYTGWGCYSRDTHDALWLLPRLGDWLAVWLVDWCVG